MTPVEEAAEWQHARTGSSNQQRAGNAVAATAHNGGVSKPGHALWAVAVAVVTAQLLAACTANRNTIAPSTGSPAASVPAKAGQVSRTAAGVPMSSGASPATGVFELTGGQGVEVAHLMSFVSAYNASDLQGALAQFSGTGAVGFSDCDYTQGRLVEGHGRAQLAAWLGQRIADQDGFVVGKIDDQNPDQPLGVLGVSFSRRTSDSIARAGHPMGITPTTAAKVKFDGDGLITEFNNGPIGGDPDSCRINVATGGAIGQASPAGNELNWVYRGTLPVESIGSIDGSAYGAWAGKHGYQPAELLGVPLLGVSVASASVLLFDISKLTSNEGNLAAFVQSASGARVVYDAPAVLTDSGIAVRVPIDGKPYVVALAAPGYSIVAFQSGGTAPQSMTAMTGASTGTGWAVFPDPTPAGSAILVQVARCQDGTCSVPLAVPVR